MNLKYPKRYIEILMSIYFGLMITNKRAGSKSPTTTMANDDGNQSFGSPDEASNSGSEDKTMQDVRDE